MNIDKDIETVEKVINNEEIKRNRLWIESDAKEAIRNILKDYKKIKKQKTLDEMLDEDDIGLLQEILNEEIFSYLDSGYSVKDDYVVILRTIIKKLNLKEIYNFDKRFKE